MAWLEGGSFTSGLVIHYRNVSSSSCTLSGYPTVVGLVSATGPSQVAAHTPVSYLGGWEPLKPLPTVLMAARKGVASSIVTFLAPYLFAENSRPSCPRGDRRFWFRSLWVNVPGGTRPFVLDVSSMIVCAYFFATPIVPGATGSVS